MNRPNLLYVFPDQFRLMSLGVWQSEAYAAYLSGKGDPVITPNLDAFALTSSLFTKAVSNCPVCSPHRGSLMTGFYPNRSGVPLNCNSTRVCSDLPKDTYCFTDVLSDAGYYVGYIGKWHLDLPIPNDPENPGHFVDPKRPAWDSYTEPNRRHGIDYWYGYGTFDQHSNPHYYDSIGKRHQPRVWSAEHEADKAVEFIENHKKVRDADKPFALFVSMNPPHSPYNRVGDCRASDLAPYQHKAKESLLVRENVDHTLDKSHCAPYYFANITGVDKEFGRILEALKKSGEWDNTLIVFTSDHGETMCSHGLIDAKNSIYNESMQVPFILKAPGQTEGHIETANLNSPDIMPTVLSAMGLKDLLPTEIHGHNVLSSTHQAPKGRLYLRNIDGTHTPDGDITDYFPVSRGIKTERYTLALEIDACYQLSQTLLFDDQKDPYQLNNLAFDPTDPDIKTLLDELARELVRISDPWYLDKRLTHLLPYHQFESQVMV